MDIQKPPPLIRGVLSGKDSDSEKDLLLPPKPGEERHGLGTKRPSRPKLFLFLLSAIAALGGFLFGYDTGVVSGAMLRVRERFHLNSTWQEIIVSVTLAAAAVSAAVAGPLSDFLGRRPILFMASIVFTVGAAVMGASEAVWMLLVGRIIVGVGIGLAAMSVPMYIAETAPAKMRGKLVVMNNLFITGGQFVATIVDGAFSGLGHNVGWRLMLGLAGIPSLLMFFGFLFMPESPRWLVYHNKEEKARKVLCKLRPYDEVEEELKSITDDYEEYKSSRMGCWVLMRRFCTSRPVLLALLVGCGLQLFQQFGGINTVMYYSASIIQMAGFSDKNAIWLAAVPGAGNFLFTIVGLLLVDRLGRRKLLIGSVIGVIFGFVLLSGAFVLMDEFSPPSKSVYVIQHRNHSCDFSKCGACVGNSMCGFCADFEPASGKYWNGTCSLGAEDANGDYSFFRPEYNASNMSCGVYSDPLPGNQSRIKSYSDASLLNADDLEREWFFNSCPNNRFAPLAIVALLIYIAFFAPGMGPLPWTINSEIYPTWARSTAIAIATSVNWICNLIVSMTFLTLADNLGQPKTFGLYAGLSFLGLLFFLLFVPETKGRSLEDVEELFQRPYFVQQCCPPSERDDDTDSGIM